MALTVSLIPTQRLNERFAGRKKFLSRALKTKSAEYRAAYHEAKKYSQSECRMSYYLYVNDIWWLSPQNVNLILLRDSGPSSIVGNASPLLKRMGSLTATAKARRTSSTINFRQSSPTKVQHLSPTWVLWLTSTNQECARY